MASVYLAVVDDQQATRQVLIAKKRCVNSFWGYGVSASGSVVQQAGQWALPGGGLDGRESTWAGAFREFREETGVEVARDATPAPNARPWIQPTNVTVHALRGPSGQPNVGDLDFSLVVLQVSPARLERHRPAGRPNLQPSTNPNQQGRPVGPLKDWELELVEVVTKAVAVARLGLAVGIPTNYHTQVAQQAGAQAWTQSVDWYARMGTEIDTHY